MRVPGHQRKSYAWRWTAALAGLAVVVLATVMAVIPALRVEAAATVTTLASATMSADTAGTPPGNGTYTTLTGPVLQEGAVGDIGTGTIILNAPAGFEFQATTVTVTASPTGANDIKVDAPGACPGATSGTAAVTASTITIEVCQDSSTGAVSKLTWSGIKVRPTVGTFVGSGNISKTGTATIVGAPANYGVLTEVNGAPATIVLTPPGAVSGPVLTILGPWSAHVEDQFANDAIGAAVAWSISSAPAGATCQQLIAPDATTNNTGDASTSLKLGNLAGNYELSVTSGGAGPTTGVATATGGPGAPCGVPTNTPTNTPVVTNTPTLSPTVTGTPPTSTPTRTATPVPGAATATPTTGPTESITLVGGTCNPVASTYPDGTAVTTIGNAVSPSGILISIWWFNPSTRAWLGYSPQFPQASDLTSVDRLEAIFICVSSAGSWSRPQI